MAEDDNDIISEGAEYSPKSDFSKARVAEEAIKKVFDLRCKEMKAGYFNITVDRQGIPQKSWIADARQVFISGVESLMALFYPEINEYVDVKKTMADFETKKESIYKKYMYKERVKEYSKDDKGNWEAKWRYTGREYLPELDAILPMDAPGNELSSEVVDKKGLWNAQVNAYYNELVVEYTKIFAELNRLVHLKNYFKRQASY